jgi:hypothetical protein
MKRAMASAIRLAGIKEGNGDGDKSDGNSVEGGWHAAAMRAMETRVAGVQWRQGQW